MAKPDSALLTRKRETPLQWEVLLVIVLALSLVLGRLLSPVFLTGANVSNILADLTEIALMALPMPVVIVLVLIAGALAGLLNGLVIVKLNLPSLAVTIGTLALFRGLAYVLLGDQAVADFPAGYTAFGMNNFGPTFIPLPFVIVIVGAMLFTVLLQSTAFGRSLYAIGANPTAAAFSGIEVAK